MIQTTAAQAAAFLVPAALISLWVAWTDMKFMLIRNRAVLTLLASFLLIGPLVLGLEPFMWRLSHLLLLLVLGFVASSAGLLGAGDAKFAAAMAPFIATADAGLALGLFAAVLPAAFVTHRLFRAMPAVRRRLVDWKSFGDTRDFPMGLALGGTLTLYLLLALRFG